MKTVLKVTATAEVIAVLTQGQEVVELDGCFVVGDKTFGFPRSAAADIQVPDDTVVEPGYTHAGGNNFTPPPTYVPSDEELDKAFKARYALVKEHRDALVSAGYSYVFPDGQTGTVQLDLASMVKLNGIVTGNLAALVTQQEGGASFCDKEDKVHALTGMQAVVFGTTVLQAVSLVYGACWAARDEMLALVADKDLDAIMTFPVAVSWPTP